MQGSRYLRETLPADDCRDLFREAQQWAKSFTPSERIPDDTVEVFELNGISLRLRLDRGVATKPVPIKYREMAMMLDAYEKYVTAPGQAGFSAAWISFGRPLKRTGYWELAQGSMMNSQGDPLANVTKQEETS